ncbi:hypothetical protein ACEQ8H_000252 [Pleosporales sp. CAS-2024a]
MSDNNSSRSSLPSCSGARHITSTFFMPALNGVPSYRPFVVMRRAEGHYHELLVFLRYLGREMYEGRLPRPTFCYTGFIDNKVVLLVCAIKELEAISDESTKTKLADRLNTLKHDFQHLRATLSASAARSFVMELLEEALQEETAAKDAFRAHVATVAPTTIKGKASWNSKKKKPMSSVDSTRERVLDHEKWSAEGA